MDRFGLRVAVRGLMDSEERLEVYNRVRAYRTNPRGFIRQWAEDVVMAREEVTTARALLPEVKLSEDAIKIGLELVRRLEIDSHRAEYTMFEAARAYAAADSRAEATVQDIYAVAPLALRQRQSKFMVEFFNEQQREDEHIRNELQSIAGSLTGSGETTTENTNGNAS
jgi:magnesium chelatase subunit I